MTAFHRKFFFACILIGLAVTLTAAQEQDAEGSKDHPLIKRYPGSIIREYGWKEFDEYELPVGPVKGGKFQKTQRLEGKITRLRYHNPSGRSSLEVFRNYAMALQQAGFETLFACKQQECGEALETDGRPARLGWVGFYSAQEYNRYVAAKLSRPEGDVYLAVNVYESPTETYRTTTLYVVEVKPMESGLVTVDAAALAGDIARTGHVAVYGIYFDTGKAEVKPESEATLKEIAKLLEENPELKVHVVGHTDNVGELAMNMELSRARADAVVKVLTTKYRVPAARLRADGVGPLAPVASNDAEEGRAKNRRVELVKQ